MMVEPTVWLIPIFSQSKCFDFQVGKYLGVRAQIGVGSIIRCVVLVMNYAGYVRMLSFREGF